MADDAAPAPKALNHKGTEATDPSSLIVCFSCLGCLGCADTLSLNGYVGNWCTVNTNMACCCLRSGCVACRGSQIAGEICQCFEADFKQIMPSTCCKTTGQTFCLDQRIAFPAEDDETKEIPCVLSLGGFNCALEWQPRFGCCQTVQTLRNGETCSEGCPWVCGTCRDCSCMSACCMKPDDLAPEHNAAADTGVDKNAPDHIPEGDSPTKMTLGQSLGASIDNIGDGEQKTNGLPPPEDLNVIMGCCCFINSIFCQFPDVFGAFGEGIVCGCCKFSLAMCKPLIAQGETFDQDICLISNARVALQMPTTCFGCTLQYFCIDSRCMLPPDPTKVPCIMNYAFINCVYDYAPACGCTLWTPLGQFKKDPLAEENQA